ncbi:DUF4214 domain-containing protein [Methylobacterium radiotolerans]|nr:hypothetical protein SR39_06495 [Methylobacterium radiotolerans]PJI55909.1 DUF4214 domain-containing protein [Methylobacterium radiotolerans]
MVRMHSQGLDLSNVVSLTIALSERVAETRRLGHLVAVDEIEAIGNVASFLRQNLDEWPPQLSRAICDVITSSPRGRSRSLLLVEYIQSGAFDQQQSGKHTMPFVMDLYRIVLGRDAEDDALRHWSAQLNAGKISRRQLLGTVISSEEFRASLN